MFLTYLHQKFMIYHDKSKVQQQQRVSCEGIIASYTYIVTTILAEKINK